MNKNKKYALNAKIVTAGTVAVVLLLNVFVTFLVQKFPMKLDMTREKIYELSEETKTMLKQYDAHVDIYFVAGANYETSYRLIGNVAQVLENYARYCPSISYTSVDSDKNPTFGQKYVKDGESIAPGSVILDGGDRYKVYDYGKLYNITSNSQGAQVASSLRAEQVLNGGLKYVAGTQDLHAYFIKGHEEETLTGLEETLADQNYTLKDLNLTTEAVPEDAKLLVLASPKLDYTDGELAKLDAFFSRAGKALITFDYTCSGLTKLYEYLRSWGIAVTDEVAVEQDQSHVLSQLGLILAGYGSSPVVSDFQANNRYVGYYPYSKTLGLLFAESGGIKTEQVLSTTGSAYSTADLEGLENTAGDTGVQTIAATAVKQSGTPGEDAVIFVSGNSALWDIQEQSIAGFGLANYDYLDKVLAFVQGTQEDYGIQPKYLSGGRLMLNNMQGLALAGIFMILLPLVILIYGIVVWFRRRHL